MRPIIVSVLLAATACGGDTSSTGHDSSDPGVDGGARTDGGGSTTAEDARVPPPIDAAPDGIPPNLTPCQEAAYHSDFTWIQDEIFTVSCDNCHGGSSPAASLDLRAGHAYAELVGVTSTIYTSWDLVAPRDSKNSMLMVRLGGETGPDVETMPKGQTPLCQEKIDAVRRWIVAGAAND